MNFTEADLSGANLSDAKAMYVNMAGACLLKADLINADFTEANLSRARARGANMHGPTITIAQAIRDRVVADFTRDEDPNEFAYALERLITALKKPIAHF